MTAFMHAIVNCDGDYTPAGRAPERIEDGRRFGCAWWADLGQVGISEARASLRQVGWGRVKVDGQMLDLCPECLAVHRVLPPGECVCPPDFCLGTDSDSGMRVECAACLALDPELPCLRDIPPGQGHTS